MAEDMHGHIIRNWSKFRLIEVFQISKLQVLVRTGVAIIIYVVSFGNNCPFGEHWYWHYFGSSGWLVGIFLL
jgi:hypothetical protein